MQILIDNRFKGDRGNDCLLSLDCVDHEIQEPYPYEREWSKRWYSHKFKGPGLRYEVALNIITGDIFWINGPFPSGAINDWMIFKSKGLLDNLLKYERVEADNGYTTGDPEFCKTPAGIHHPQERRAYRNRVMGRQEMVNKRNKQWRILDKVFRHPIEKHQIVFHAVNVITQIAIENGEPLFDTGEYAD